MKHAWHRVIENGAVFYRQLFGRNGCLGRAEICRVISNSTYKPVKKKWRLHVYDAEGQMVVDFDVPVLTLPAMQRIAVAFAAEVLVRPRVAKEL